MEHEADAPKLQPEPWQKFFPRLSLEPHLGQRQVFESAASDPVGDKLIVMPTGYGKTLSGAGYYVIRRELGLVNRCLWVVSSDEQLKQLSPVPDKKTGKRDPTVSDRIAGWFGLSCHETVTATGAPSEYLMHRKNRAEIFPVSYQFLRMQATYFSELLDSEEGDWRWLVIADEAHHLGLKGSWAEWLEDRLPRVETLYMSATPLRTDKTPLRNVPSKPAEDGSGSTYDARVERTWKQAMDEHAIRRPKAHVQEWQLEFKDRAGQPVTVTTSQLRDLDITNENDFDKWVVKHDLHYTMTYLQRIIFDAINRLNEKRTQWPGTHQMLVFAMSCSHAKFLVHDVFNKLDELVGADADWIGVARPAAENKEVMDKYKAGKLSVLVQVDKAGEGFDNPPSSVALFLNLIQSNTKLLQQLGRILRRLFDIPYEQDIADVFANSSHPVIDVVRSMQPTDKNYDEPGEDDDTGDGGGDRIWPSLPELLEITAQWIRTNIVEPEGTQPLYSPDVIVAADQFGLSPEIVKEVVRVAQGKTAEAVETKPAGEIGLQAVMRDRVDRTMRLVVSHAIGLTAQNGGVDDAKQLAGRIKKNLNTRWKAENVGHDSMLSEDFGRKYTWLRDIDEEMKRTREVPSWLARSR
jgi:superfamily II DNA or RNA helicase